MKYPIEIFYRTRAYRPDWIIYVTLAIPDGQ